MRASLRSPMPILAAIVLFAFASRLFLAVHTLPLYDELQWMGIADRIDLRPSSLALPAHGDQHPPGQAYWAKLGTLVLGRNLLGYRFVAVLLAAGSVLALYGVGREMFGPRAGLIAAFLLAVNEYHLDVGHRCSEKTYLAFAMFALLATLVLLRRNRILSWVALAVSLGLGIFTKQTLILWTIPLLVFIGKMKGRRVFKGIGPAVGAIILILLIGIDLAWNVAGRDESTDPSSKGIAYQVSKLQWGRWSWAPLALYIRPLYFNRVEGTISEYASLTTFPGCLVLAGALASLVVLRSPAARLLQVLGWGIFLFFSLGSDPRGEFWWADLSLPPFVILTAGVLNRLWSRWRLAVAPILVGLLFPAFRVLRSKDAYHALEWGAPPPIVVEQFKNSQRFQFLQFGDRDFVALSQISPSVLLPAASLHAANLRAYRDLLTSNDPLAKDRRALGLPVVAADQVANEVDWVDEQLARLENRSGLSHPSASPKR